MELVGSVEQSACELSPDLWLRHPGLTHYAKALYLISKKILHMGTIAFEYGTNSLDECVKNLTIDTKRIVTEFVDIYLSEIGTALDTEDLDGTTITGQLQAYVIVSIIRYWKYLAIHPDRLKQAHPELTAEDALTNANDAQANGGLRDRENMLATDVPSTIPWNCCIVVDSALPGTEPGKKTALRPMPALKDCTASP